MSKKMPGTTIVFSFSSSSKKVCIHYQHLHHIGGGCSKEETNQTVVERGRELLKVEPYVECARRRDVYVKLQLVQALENMVALRLEVLLKRNLVIKNQA